MNHWKAFRSLTGTLLLLFTGSCRQPEDTTTTSKPDNLVAPERMAQILAEVHITEARVSRMGLRSSDSSAIVYKRLEQNIYKKYQVDTAAYAKSYTYYSTHPAELEAIYNEVVEKLKKKTHQPPTKPSKQV